MARSKKVAGKKAKKTWLDVSSDKGFWVNNGPVLVNLLELPDALKSMDMDTFKHHVSKEHNDFANWVEHVMGEAKLAKQMRKTSAKSKTLDLVKKRLY